MYIHVYIHSNRDVTMHVCMAEELLSPDGRAQCTVLKVTKLQQLAIILLGIEWCISYEWKCICEKFLGFHQMNLGYTCGWGSTGFATHKG